MLLSLFFIKSMGKVNNMVVAVSESFDEVEYCSHFKLLQSPFSNEFDASKFYGGGTRSSVLEDLMIKIQLGNASVFI